MESWRPQVNIAATGLLKLCRFKRFMHKTKAVSDLALLMYIITQNPKSIECRHVCLNKQTLDILSLSPKDFMSDLSGRHRHV